MLGENKTLELHVCFKTNVSAASQSLEKCAEAESTLF
jgi:hypothetical protein